MINTLISHVVRQEVLQMSAYKVAEAHGLIKLDAMENPYSWPESIKQQWLDKIKDCPINRYPDPEAAGLTSIIRQSNGVPDQAELMLGNGSDEIIQILLMALKPGASVMAPTPGFVMYQQIAVSLGLTYFAVPLNSSDFSLDGAAMIECIEQNQPEVIFLAYPNNPTGNLFDEQVIETIVKTSQGLVVIDEAYAPFAKATFMNRLTDFSNLLVMRTVSKLGLAGLRLGFMAGHADIIEQLNKIRLPYNINVLSQITAEFALQHKSVFDQQTDQICADRADLFHQLNALSGIQAFASAANFILFRTAENKADDIFEQLKQHKILIKNLSPQGGLLKDCLRVTIGKPEENRAFTQALTNILSKE